MEIAILSKRFYQVISVKRLYFLANSLTRKIKYHLNHVNNLKSYLHFEKEILTNKKVTGIWSYFVIQNKILLSPHPTHKVLIEYITSPITTVFTSIAIAIVTCNILVLTHMA